MIKACIGIDPGTTGAAALLAHDGHYLIHDWGGLEPAAVFLQCCKDDFDVVGIGIEDVTGLGMKRGWKGTEVLLRNFGTWLGLIMGIFKDEPRLIKPQEWQRQLPPHIRKMENKLRAQEWLRFLMPKMEKHLCRKKDHNRAEAVLICLHTRELVRWRGKIELDIIN